jgi:hypothetical protein
MQLAASILDYPRTDLDKSIWDTTGKELDFRPEIRDDIEDIISSFLDDLDLPPEALLDVFIYGSILTNQYNSKTDVDARIVLDPEIVHEQYPGIGGDQLYDMSIDTIHGVLLGNTQHPFNATVILKDEESELAKSPLGITERDPVYDFLNKKIIHEGKWYEESFDPDVEFAEERDEVTEIMDRLDKLIQEAKTETIDYELIKEAIGDVKSPDKLVEKLEGKLENIENTIAQLIKEYDDIKEERSTSYKDAPSDDRHKAPGNIQYKLLEKYKYMDVLKKLKQIFKGGIEKKEVPEVADVLQFEGMGIDLWPGPNVNPDAPPTSRTGPPKAPMLNPQEAPGGGMMHGGSTCPSCGHDNPMTASDGKEITCEKCGKKFELESTFSISTAPSTPQLTSPYTYESDFPLYPVRTTAAIDPRELPELERMLREIGVSESVIEQFVQKVTTPEEMQVMPESPEGPQPPEPPEGPPEPPAPMAPEEPEAPKEQGTPVPSNVIRQKPMKQLGIEEGVRWWELSREERNEYFKEREQVKADFVLEADIGNEYKSAGSNMYAAILPEMSDPEQGPVRVQWYNLYTPIGHTTYKDVYTAAKQVFEELGPNIERADGSMDKFALSDEWLQSLQDIREVQRFNREFTEWFDKSSTDMKEIHLRAAILALGGFAMHKYASLFDDGTPQLNPGESLYPGGGPLADPTNKAKKETKQDKEKEKKKKKEKGVDEDIELEIVTILEGLDILPFLTDEKLLEELLATFPILGEENNNIDKLIKESLWTEPPEGTGQFTPPPPDADYRTEPRSRRRRGPREDGSGKGKGRPGGLRRRKNIEECPIGGPGEGKGEGRGKGRFRDKIKEEGEAVGIDWFDSQKKYSMDKEAAAYMSLCPNCGTPQRLDYWENTRCPNCTFPIPGYFWSHVEDELAQGQGEPREPVPEDRELEFEWEKAIWEKEEAKKPKPWEQRSKKKKLNAQEFELPEKYHPQRKPPSLAPELGTDATVGDVLRRAEIEDEWDNFGDIDYITHGGVQLKWDGNDEVEFVSLAPINGCEWMIESGSIDLGYLVDNRNELFDQYGPVPNWPIAELDFSKYAIDVIQFADAEDIKQDPTKLIWLLTGMLNYGGVDTDNVYIGPDDIVSLISQATNGRIVLDEEDVKSFMLPEKTQEDLEKILGADFDIQEYAHDFVKHALPDDLAL